MDQWLVPSGRPLRALSADLRGDLERHEAAEGTRKRARKGADQETFRTLVDITTANLALAVLNPPPSGALAVRGGKLAEARTRYDHPAFGKQFRPMLDRLEAIGWSVLDVSTRRNEVSNLRLTEAFAGRVRAAGVTLRDFGRHPEEEVIRLAQRVKRSDGHTRHRQDYPDTEVTMAMRVKLREVNAFLAAADITFIPDGLGPDVNDQERRLVRQFTVDDGQTPTFDRGGRLFGGFWVNLPATRRHAIRIGGEPIADLDFSNMFVRLAYAHLGKRPPEGDLYAIPGLEAHRSGVKLAINTLFWDEKRTRKHWPKEMGVGVGSDVNATVDPEGTAAAFTGRLPVGWGKVSRLTRAIRERHLALAPAFGVGLGGSLMFRESEIMRGVLGRMMEEGVVGLPLHDGLMVSRSEMDRAKGIMEEVSVEMIGHPIPVSEKWVEPSGPV